jgi:isocitrate dehydrogenase (NAD+)
MARPATKYGLRYTVSLIPGDGIGKELCRSVQNVFSSARVPVDFEEVSLSGYSSHEGDLQKAIASLRRHRIGLKGIIYTPPTGPQTSINVAIRQALDIYANVVQIRALPGCQARHPEIDMIVIRENTEGEYSGLEHAPSPGIVESLKMTTREKSRRIVQFAFDYCVQNGRRKVTCIHKANIMKLTDGLFLRTFQEVAAENRHTGLEVEHMIVDNAAMQLVSHPTQFDVIVTPNLYGNIVTNIGAGLVGSAGLIPGYNIGRDHAIFEPVLEGGNFFSSHREQDT